MHLLILGGTVFLGRVLVAEALARGHKVTVFNRGTRPSPEGATTVVGDRRASDGYSGLDGMVFDVVIDTWSEEAEAVTSAIKALRGRFSHYTYISTCMVYNPDTFDFLGEEETLLYWVDVPGAEESAYQYNKRGGEIAAAECGAPVFLVRPGIILGPHEQVVGMGGRLPWWLPRFHRGGRVVAPGPKELSTSFIDVRDLANFTIVGMEKGLAGGYSVMGRPDFPTMQQLLDNFNDVTSGHAQLVWKTPEEISAIGMNHIFELPLWCPPNSREYGMLNLWDTTKAREAGLVTRPSNETVKDTWD